MIRADGIFAQATVLEKDHDTANKSIFIEKVSAIVTGSIQPKSVNEKMIMI